MRSLRLRFLPVAVASLAFAVTASGKAPTDQYKGFQSTDTEILDNFTKLLWDRAPLYAQSLSAAQTYCAGRSKRLPTLKELLTIVDETPHRAYAYDDQAKQNKEVDTYLDTQAFGYVHSVDATQVDKAYWTSTPDASGSSYYAVDFARGTIATNDPSAGLHVRCVVFSPF